MSFRLWKVHMTCITIVTTIPGTTRATICPVANSESKARKPTAFGCSSKTSMPAPVIRMAQATDLNIRPVCQGERSINVDHNGHARKNGSTGSPRMKTGTRTMVWKYQGRWTSRGGGACPSLMATRRPASSSLPAVDGIPACRCGGAGGLTPLRILRTYARSRRS